MFENIEEGLATNERTAFKFEPSLSNINFMLDGGYSALYDNRIPADIKYIDYDRNVKHIGKAEYIIVRIFTYVSIR